MATVSPISSRAAASAPAPLATNLHGAAAYLAVSVSSVRRQIASGKLPAARLGHRLVIRYAAFHEGSDQAVKILEAARLQGKFEPVMEALLEFQPEWADHDKPDLEKAWARAKDAGLDIERGKRDAARPEFQAILDKDGADAKALEVSRTPTFFVNGQPLAEFGPRPLYEMVKREVEKARK